MNCTQMSGHDFINNNADSRRTVAIDWLLITVLLGVFIVSTAIYVSRVYYGLLIYPLDGVQQTFNPIYRLSVGQTLYKDFIPYLGYSSVGPLYFLLSALRLPLDLGHATALNEAINIFAAVSGMVLIAYITSRRLLLSVAASVSILLLISWVYHYPFADWVRNISFPLREFVLPGNSNLGLRCSILYLGLGLLLSYRGLLGRVSPTTAGGRSIRAALSWLLGLMLPLVPLWSSDYGTVALLMLALGLLGLWFSERGSFRPTLFELASVALGGSVTIATSILLWPEVVRNIVVDRLAVQQAQYWYFGGPSSEFIFSLSTVRWTPMLIAALVFSAIAVFIGIWFRKSGRIATWSETYFIVFVPLGSVVTGLLTNVAGGQSDRYLIPGVFWTGYLILAALLSLAAPMKHRTIRSVIAATALVIMVSAGLLEGARGYVNAYAAERSQWLFQPALSTKLPDVDAASIAWGQDPANRPWLSTFRGYLDYISANPPMGNQDYIIHALSAKDRAAFARPVSEGRVGHVLTPRVDLASAEAWLRSANMWFYEPLIKHYEIDRFFLNYTLWRLRTTPWEASGSVECQIMSHDASFVVLSLQGRNFPDARGRRAYYSIHLTYDSTPARFQFRSRVSARVVGSDGSAMELGIPPQSKSWAIGSLSDSSQRAEVALHVSPSSGNLTVQECRGSFLAWQDELQKTLTLRINEHSDQNWDHGLATATGPLGSVAGVMFSTAEEISEIRPQSIVRFADGTTRRVVWQFGSQVWMDGPRLTPDVVGGADVDFVLQ